MCVCVSFGMLSEIFRQLKNLYPPTPHIHINRKLRKQKKTIFIAKRFFLGSRCFRLPILYLYDVKT